MTATVTATGGGLRIVPVDRDDAKAFTRMWHRHHGHVLLWEAC